jgi:hypothetical protein
VAGLLRQTGRIINDKRVERIWRREGLKVSNKQPKRGAGNIGLAEALRHHTFEAELARMAKYNVSAFSNVFVQPKSRGLLMDQLSERTLCTPFGSRGEKNLSS